VTAEKEQMGNAGANCVKKERRQKRKGRWKCKLRIAMHNLIYRLSAASFDPSTTIIVIVQQAVQPIKMLWITCCEEIHSKPKEVEFGCCS